MPFATPPHVTSRPPGKAGRFPVVAAFCLLMAAWLGGCSEATRLDLKCEAGNVAVCSQLGDMYATGRGVPRDLARAAQSYERACNGGAADVCNTVGEIVENSGSVEGGLSRAEQLFQKACQGGSSRGCLNLGLAAAARENKELAFALYEKSCGGGWAPGCHQLAVSYEQGEGVAKDVSKAITFYSQACDGEHVESCVAAGNLYLGGESVGKDVALATRYFGKALQVHDEACHAGSQIDCTERDRLRTRLALISAGQGFTVPPAVK